MLLDYRHRKQGWVRIDIETYSNDDHIGKILASTGTFYEEDLLRYIEFIGSRHGRRGVYIDVGANIGNHSIYFGKFLADLVVSVEPNPAVLPVLRRNLGSNLKQGSFRLFECALGAEEGRGSVAAEREGAADIGQARIRVLPKGEAPANAVEITTLDSLVARLEAEQGRELPIAAIKVDVEGMELEVLKGARETLLRKRPHLFLEAMGAKEKQALDSFLGDFGYRAIARWAFTPVYHYGHRPSLLLRARAMAYRVAVSSGRRMAKVCGRRPRG